MHERDPLKFSTINMYKFLLFAPAPVELHIPGSIVVFSLSRNWKIESDQPVNGFSFASNAWHVERF